MPEAHYPIQKAARLTGLSPQVIRIWEHRYRAVEPERTPTNRRLYSPRDLERLRLLREATTQGTASARWRNSRTISCVRLASPPPVSNPLAPPPSLAAPLSQALGDLWRQGEITAAHEHFASARLRVLLGHLAKPFGGSDRAPVLIVATPAGQLHELGALLVGALAANLGWLVTPLGASLPASDLAECGVALDRLRQPARGAAQ